MTESLPGGAVHVLRAWEDSGGAWSVESSSDGWVTFILSRAGATTGGSRMTSARTTVLNAFLAGRTTSSDPVR